jgi:predicted component of type VI protein secretion system
MSASRLTQQTVYLSLHNDILSWVESFLIDRKSQHLTPGTICYYREKIERNFTALSFLRYHRA